MLVLSVEVSVVVVLVLSVEVSDELEELLEQALRISNIPSNRRKNGLSETLEF